MIRITVLVEDCGAAANVGGSVEKSLKTFMVDHPKLEAFLAEKLMYQSRQIIGYEIVDAPQAVVVDPSK